MSFAAVADIYELSPMQKAMLFHTLYSPGAITSFNQFSCRITGDLDGALFRESWQRLLNRQPVLRTSFHWEELDKPVQIVHSDVRLPWLQDDWRDLSSDEQRARWREHLRDDLASGFRLSEAPLMRSRLARVADREYLFSWSHHHLLTDGWCLSLVMDEIFQVYGHLTRESPLKLAPVRPYRDYIEWLQRQDPEASRQFWTRYLDGFRSPTPMPSPMQRGEYFGAAVEQLHCELTEDFSRQLRNFAAEHRITPSTIAQGAWAIILARYSAEADVVFGTTVSGRPTDLPGIENMLGLFINTIPVRMRVDSKQAIAPWLKMIHARQVARTQFEHTPLPDIQRWSEIPAATPLFESNLIFMNYPLDEALTHGAHGIAIEEITLYDRADVPVELMVTARTRWNLELGFDPQRFDVAKMRRMLGHLVAVLEGFVAEPAKAIGRLSILTPAERRQILEDFNDTAVDFDTSETFVHRFERAAAEFPDRIVAEFEGKTVSARQLNARANRFAYRLLERADPQRDDIVAIVAQRSDRMMEAILATWKCGAAYLPIDPDDPPDRIRGMLEGSRAKLVVTEADMLDDDDEFDPGNLGRPILPDSLAYVIYTSGSTGKPKGAMLEHAGMLNHLLAKIEEFAIGPSTAIAQSASHCFDISVWQFFAAPLGGGRTVILSNDVVHDPARFLEQIYATGINILELVPSHLAVLLDHSQSFHLRNLNYLLATGETVNRSLLERWFSFFPNIPVVNAYGPTEASDDVTTHHMRGLPPTPSAPAGKPIRNMRIYITDDQMNLCPIGVNGEICVAGIGVGRGYINDEARTKISFLDDPFQKKRVRLYRTGDIGCFLADGTVLLAGRKDHQIKVRGHRVELGEIENALTRLPQIREAAVMAHPDSAGHLSLCAYVVFRPEQAIASDDISAVLAATLPDYMVPNQYVTLDQLPLNRNGKINRAGLPAPNLSRSRAERVSAPPRSAIETLLCDIWGETLGIKAPGIHDNFFALGGDSILSMRIVSLAARACLKITTRQIFQYPTVAELATVASVSSAKQANVVPFSGSLPLTPIQKRFFLQCKEQQNIYNQAVLLEVPANLDLAVLRFALKHSAEVHDALQLRFRAQGSAWVQEVVNDPEIPLGVHDISPDQLAGHIELAHSRLDLTAGPVFRAEFFRFHEALSGRLLLVAHHLTIDAVSWGTLVETIYSTYTRLRTGATPELHIHGSSWADWARAVASSSPSTDSSPVCTPSTILVDYDPPNGANTVASSEEIIVDLSESATTALLTSAKRAYNTQINDLLLAALALTINCWTGDSKILLDLEGHGRDEVPNDLDITRTVGWFTTIRPVLLEAEGPQADLAVLIKSVKEQLRSGVVPESTPQPQLLFNYLGQTEHLLPGTCEWRLAPESSGSGQSPNQRREHLLAINSYIVNDRLRVAWEFSLHFHRKNTIEELAQNDIAALELIAAHCTGTRVAGLAPSDFPAARLSQRSLDTLAACIQHEISDIYELTPTQQGMLFHSLYAPGSDAYFNSLNFRIDGDLDVERFRRAWRKVIERHAILRTSFHWDGLEKPVQVVHQTAPLPWFDEDLSALPAELANARWRNHLQQDCTRKFDFAEAPLMRVSLFRLAPEAWRFHWSTHHILLDGWSSALVMSDVVAAYESLQNGREFDLPSAPPFREHVVWLQTQNSAAAEDFWRTKLHDFSTPSPLPLGRPELEGTAAPGKYDEEEILLNHGDTARLVAFAQTNHLTMNTIAQGAWAILLGRYSGESDVVFGTIVSGRPAEIPGSDRMVGLFINSLPVRVQIGENPLSFWLQQLQSDLAQQDEYAYFPLAEIQKFADLPAGTPLFESLLIFQNYPVQEALEKEAAGLRISEFQAFDPNNYPLTVVVTPGERLSVRALFDNGRFDRATITRVLGHFETLVTGFVRDASALITKLAILTKSEINQILEWNDTAAPVPWNKTLVDLIEDAVLADPNRVAVRCGKTVRTYREISRRSDSIARGLLKLAPLEAEDRIAVVMPRSETMVETILAIWKCGAAYVPIDPAYPAHRIEAILSGAKPKIILARDSDLDGRHMAVRVAHPDLFPDIDSTEPLERRCQPANLAYVIFTSGSTGKPKGAMLEHRGMINHVLAMAHRLDLSPKSVVAQTASQCSDISVWQLFAALVSGGETVIYPDSTVLEPAVLIDCVRRDGVTAMQFVPTYLSIFLAELEKSATPSLSRIETLVTIGETLQPASVRAWFRLNPGTRLVNAYGPTEASDSIAHYSMDRPPELPSIPIGKPIQNMRLYVVDAQMNLCPIGVKGEICVSGVGVGRGYLFDEERTRAAFERDPFRPEVDARLYHTGDIGSFAPDGNLLFFGRHDFQVKIRGYRIELGEIESVLTGLDGISNAVVVACDDPQGDKYLCAYAAGNGWTPTTLRDALSEKLPAHMLPDVMVLLPELPVMPNGKINRKALPASEARLATTTNPVPPSNEAEVALARVFSEVLGRGAVGVNDNFFHLGGHSLKAIQIISRIRSELSLEASITDIFTAPTPRALARKLDCAASIEANEIEALPPRTWYAASHAQKRLWLASRGAEQPSTYNMAGALHLEGPLDFERMSRALEALVERHESLRTVFAIAEGELKQRILTREESGFRVEEGSTRDGLDELIREEANRPFDLAKGPLFRAKLIRLAPERSILLLTLHHVVADAWSIQVLTQELRAIYAGHDLPPLTIQYRDYAQWHNALLEGAAAQAHRDYWLKKLAPPIPRLRLPYDYPRPAGRAHSGHSITAEIEDPLLAGLNKLARTYNVSLYAVVLSSICVLLHGWTFGEEIVIGAVSAGREREEFEPLVGAFLNPFALRVRLQDSNTIQEVIRAVSRASSEALDHASWPFDLVLEELKVRTPPNRSPLFDVQVDYIPAHPSQHDALSSDLRVTDISQSSGTSKFDLSFHITEEAGKLHIMFIYNTGLFRSETIARLRDRLIELQEAFVRDPHTTVERVAPTSADQRKVRVGLRLKSSKELA